MRRIARHPPSPALVVAIVALIVATAGTATAASVLIKGSRQVAPNAINSGDLADGRAVNVADLTSRARQALGAKPGSPGGEGQRGAQGPPGARGEPGPPGDKGVDGTARAFAYMSGTGSLDTANSKGVNSASRAQAGVYCLDLEPAPRNVVGSIDGAEANTGDLVYPVLPITANGENLILTFCTSPETDAMVIAVNSGGGLIDRAFWVNFN